MHSIRNTGVRQFAVILAATGGLAASTLSAQSNGLGERFSAVAMDMERGTTAQLEIAVERWSSDAQRSRLLSVLTEKGPEKLLDVLQDTPKVGYIRTTTSLAWDLHYAWRARGEDGGERVVLITNRPISFWEAANQPRTMEYPFTVIEMRLNNDGQGQGMLSVATKITRDKKTGDITLENWGTQPVRLTEVTAERVAQ